MADVCLDGQIKWTSELEAASDSMASRIAVDETSIVPHCIDPLFLMKPTYDEVITHRLYQHDQRYFRVSMQNNSHSLSYASFRDHLHVSRCN